MAKRTLLLFIIGVALTCFTSCLSRGGSHHGPGEEGLGMQMLQEARSYMQDGRYSEARSTIMSLREEHPTALTARRQAILTLDSIELLAAQDSLQQAQGEEWKRLQVKVEFFQRKIQHDKTNQ